MRTIEKLERHFRYTNNCKDGVLVVEGRCQTKDLIGATFRDLLRTLDKLGGDSFTSSARKRKYEEGNAVTSVKHYWGGKNR